MVEYAIRMGYATHCTINPVCKADRKNYFYPDLPKAYCILQSEISRYWRIARMESR